MSYQIARDGEQIGTFTEEELVDAVERGDIRITDMAWTEGMDEWEAVETLIEIEEVEEDGEPAADAAPEPEPSAAETAVRPLGRAGATSHYAPHPASPVAQPDRYGAPPPQMVRGSLYGSIPAGQYGPAGSAIASLVLGILSLVFSFLTGIPAVLAGHAARRKIRRTGGAFSGHGMAVAGIVLGYVTSTLGVVALAWFLMAGRGPGSKGPNDDSVPAASQPSPSAPSLPESK